QEAPAVQEPAFNHATRVANLIHMYRIESGLRPEIAESSELKGDDWRKKQTEIKRAQRKRDYAMENACLSCPRQDGCEIKANGFEEGMATVHPRLIPSEKYPHTNKGETLQAMIIRISNNSEAHCDPAQDGIFFEVDKMEPVISIDAGEAQLAVPLVDHELETAYEKRNEKIKEASDFLNQSHRDKATLKYRNPANPTAVEKLEKIHFAKFAGKLEEACGLCPDHGHCPIANDANPAKAWENAHYYSDQSSDPDWPYEINTNGIGHESRKKFFSRIKQDSHASCVPPAIDSEDMPKVA
ncbi:MAG: hypothetical protein AAB914_02885, partial [Patescibacteria group bacterium]